MRNLRSGMCALAVVSLCAGVNADSGPRLVIVSAEVSATGTTLFVSGANFGRSPGVSLGGTPLGGVAVNRAGTQLTAIMPALAPGSYLVQVWRGRDRGESAKLSLAVGGMGPKGDTGAKGDKGDPGAPGVLALAGLMCPPGQLLRGFSSTGALVCEGASPPATSCGDGTIQSGEEFDPAPGPFLSAPVSAATCKFDFSNAPQLYCNGTCSYAGAIGCDQGDADVLCKLKTGNPDSVALSFVVGQPLDAPGFSCPSPGYGTLVPNTAARGVNLNVYYSDTSILSTHGGGDAVTSVVCTTP